MRIKKLIRNVMVILTVVMTAAMILSSCGNAGGTGGYAKITIHMGEKGSARAISDAEKSASTLNVYFNDSLVASNVSGTYNGMAQVGIRLNIRVDAIVNGKRIARGENTITVRSPSNDVDIKLYENREQSSGELKGTPQIGSIIMKDGTLCDAASVVGREADAIAVVYKVDTSVKKAWAVGKELSSSIVWADNNAEGYGDIEGLQEENGYTDGSTGLAILQETVSDADDANLATNYPAWDYACNYGRKNSLSNFQTGWYLPCKGELKELWDEKDNMPLINFPADNTSDSSLWSSTQDASEGVAVWKLKGNNGNWTSTNGKGGTGPTCAVRQFTY